MGNYRGNWSPYIPRNLILRYTQPGEHVLDRKRESTYALRAYRAAISTYGGAIRVCDVNWRNG
ncbi:MAG: hypothetical protein O8C66_00265 [Candidatus Methanoperedens sp.]|nr:hypothetical protein [Candidatus Methanoperedens sp.]MCZ7368924.1 hypothetical protein [Candidatus Methanoperedens sp.]